MWSIYAARVVARPFCTSLRGCTHGSFFCAYNRSNPLPLPHTFPRRARTRRCERFTCSTVKREAISFHYLSRRCEGFCREVVVVQNPKAISCLLCTHSHAELGAHFFTPGMRLLCRLHKQQLRAAILATTKWQEIAASSAGNNNAPGRQTRND